MTGLAIQLCRVDLHISHPLMNFCMMGIFCAYIMRVQFPVCEAGFRSFDAYGLNYLMHSICKGHVYEWFLDGYHY